MKQPSSIITRRTGNSYLLGNKFWADNTFQFFPASAGIIPEFSLYLFFSSANANSARQPDSQ
jgi:hypothetical protein